MSTYKILKGTREVMSQQVQSKVEWNDFVNTVMNLWCYIKHGECCEHLNEWTTVSFLKLLEDPNSKQPTILAVWRTEWGCGLKNFYTEYVGTIISQNRTNLMDSLEWLIDIWRLRELWDREVDRNIQNRVPLRTSELEKLNFCFAA